MFHLSNPEARRKSTNGERERVVAFGKFNSVTVSARRTCNRTSLQPFNPACEHGPIEMARRHARSVSISKLRKSVGPHLDHSSQLSDQSRQYHDGIQPVHWKRDTAILASTGQRYQQVDIFLHTITPTLTSTSTLQPVSVSGGLVPSCTSVSPVTIVATQVDRVIAPAASRTLVPFCTAYLYEYGTAAGATVSNAALCASKATPPYIAAQWYSVSYAPTSTQSWCSIFSTVYQEQWYSGWSMYTALTAVGTPAVSVT